MATRIHVYLDGVAVQGADVYVGSVLGEKLTTNANGRVSFALTDGWKGFVNVMVEGIPSIDRVVSQVLLREGRDHDINITQP